MRFSPEPKRDGLRMDYLQIILPFQCFANNNRSWDEIHTRRGTDSPSGERELLGQPVFAVGSGLGVVEFVAAVVPADQLGRACGADVAVGLLLRNETVVARELQKQRRGRGPADKSLGIQHRIDLREAPASG